jgi:hypothetical protein
MMRMKLVIPVLLGLAMACHFPQKTLKPAPTAQRELIGVWTDHTFLVQTKNLMIYYPDFVDPAEARTQADTLQKGYDAYRVIFSFDDEPPYGGQKTAIVFDPRLKSSMSGGGNIIQMGTVVMDAMREGYINPPDPTFLHEMVHTFDHAQPNTERYYVYNFIGALGEALAEYMICYPDIFKLWEQDGRAKEKCDITLYGIGSKSDEYTLEYFETHTTDPYTLDWSVHPSGWGGEYLFPQMLARVSDAAGWDVWKKFFSATRASGGNPAAKEAYLYYYDRKGQTMSDPLVKKAFAEFITTLSQSSGKDFTSMFRGWGFEV